MAKNKKKKKQSQNQNSILMTPATIRHMRIVKGGDGVVSKLHSYTIDDIVIGTYIETKKEKANKLLHMYEKMLLDAKTEPSLYIEKRSDMIEQIRNYIVENNLYREWMDLPLIVNEGMQEGNMLNAYMDEIMETWRDFCYLKPGRIICGFSREGELLSIPDHFGDWDVPFLKIRSMFEKRQITEEEYNKQILDRADVGEIARDETIWNIELLDMLPFINERTIKVLPEKPMSRYSTPRWRLPEQWRGTRIYKESIMKRTYMIGKKGVRVRFRSAESAEELFLMEDMDRNNELVMLYQLKIEGYGSFSGYYRPKQQLFFSPFLRTNYPELHKGVENFVLGIYADIVSELDKERKRTFRIEEVSSIQEIPSPVPTRVYYQYVSVGSNREHSGETQGEHRSQRPHPRNLAVRKLNDNQRASEEAKQRAIEYGVQLQEGYTFVRPYDVGKKKVEEKIKG